MKQFLMFSLALVMTIGGSSCNAQGNKNTATNKVEVYYFHFTHRCNTCISVEETAKKAVETLYPDKIKTGEYVFTSLNLDDANGKSLGEKLGVGGQTLLVVYGGKKIDITDKGFMNANDLEKMKAIISKTVNDLKMN